VNAALDALQQIDPEDTAARQPHFDTIQTRLEADMPYIPVLIGGTTSEYNARKFTGWPSEDDLYAFPAVWQRPDNSQIYLNLKPAGGE
jgi:peptide/nickel transport system substrate-binding protein